MTDPFVLEGLASLRGTLDDATEANGPAVALSIRDAYAVFVVLDDLVRGYHETARETAETLLSQWGGADNGAI